MRHILSPALNLHYWLSPIKLPSPNGEPVFTHAEAALLKKEKPNAKVLLQLFETKAAIGGELTHLEVPQKGIAVDAIREESPMEDLGFTRHVEKVHMPHRHPKPVPEDKKRGLEICGNILETLKKRTVRVEPGENAPECPKFPIIR